MLPSYFDQAYPCNIDWNAVWHWSWHSYEYVGEAGDGYIGPFCDVVHIPNTKVGKEGLIV